MKEELLCTLDDLIQYIYLFFTLDSTFFTSSAFFLFWSFWVENMSIVILKTFVIVKGAECPVDQWCSKVFFVWFLHQVIFFFTLVKWKITLQENPPLLNLKFVCRYVSGYLPNILLCTSSTEFLSSTEFFQKS